MSNQIRPEKHCEITSGNMSEGDHWMYDHPKEQSGLEWKKRPPRTTPTTVNVQRIIQHNPRHKNCNLVIKTSAKNRLYTGLYCQEHNHWYQWLNPDQRGYLIELGVSDESTPLFGS